VKEHSPQLQPTTAQRAHAAVRTPGADRLGSGPGAPRRGGGPRGEAILQLQRSLGSQAAARMAAARPPSSPLAAPVQRKREYVNYQGNHVEVIRKKLRALEAREKVETPLTNTEFIYGLSGLTLSPLDYGVIDLEDDQHLMLLYRYIRKQARPLARDGDPENRIQDQEQTALEEQLDQKALLEGRTREGKPSYRVALLGAGASIAYYVATQRFEPGEAVIIGTPQPWGGQRGPGVVAHPAHMITPMLDYLGEADTAIDDVWLDRAEFSKLVERVLNRAGIPRIRGKVTGVDREEDAGRFYKITVEDRDLPIYAQEVVSGIGVGEHIPPNGPDGKRVAPEKIARHGDEVGPARRIMDMDVFTQVAGRLVKTDQGVEVGEGGNPAEITVVLSGPNGGIDVAFDALLRGYKVKWIVGTNGPRFLPGFPNYAAYLAYLRSLREDQLGTAKIKDRGKAQEEANATLEGLYDVQDQKIFGKAMQRFDKEGAHFEEVIFGRAGAVEETDKGVKVKVVEKDEVYGDIMVYAQGQGPGNFALFEKFLDDLVPEKDVDRRFTDKGDTTIGLRSRDNTLKIVGATAFRLAPQVPEPPEDTQEKMRARYNALFGALKGARGAGFGNGDLVLGDVWLKYYQLMKATYPSLDEVNPEPIPQLQKFAAAYRAYLAYSAELRTKGPTEEQKEALNAFDKALGAPQPGIEGKMTPVIATLPANVQFNDQLTPSRSQIVASTGFLPYDIGRRANFVTDDRTALAAHISARYGKLADKPGEVERVVNAIITSRRKLEGGPRLPVPPHGKKFQQYWEGELDKLNV
jgi:hypothetical protein